MTLNRFLAAAAVASAIACSSKEPSKTDTTAAATSTAAAQTKSDTSHAASGGATQPADPDHDFLRMMSDHHKGLIAIAHETIETKKSIGVKPTAKRLDAEQDKDMDQISTMLDSLYKDSHTPTILPENRAMLDALENKTGSEYDRQFLEDVVKHHEQGVQMIDDYLPKAKHPAIKALAEAMKSVQRREITEFEARLQSKKD